MERIVILAPREIRTRQDGRTLDFFKGSCMSHVALFFAGAFLCNSIPHLCSGLQGRRFPTPFAKPRGVGESPPIANFFWGIANLLVGIYLLSRQPLEVGINPEFMSLTVGALLMGTYLSIHFGRVRPN
jgi:hypothetical protein